MRQYESRARWGAGLALVLLVLTVGCRPASESMPDHLTGYWQTSAATHAGTTMKLTRDVVVFTGKDGTVMAARVIDFATIQEQAATFYRIAYVDEDKNEYRLDIVYNPADGGTVTFKHQPNLVWTRAGDSL